MCQARWLNFPVYPSQTAALHTPSTCVSVLISTAMLETSKQNSPCITTDSVWGKLMRMRQRSLDRRFFRETASLVMIKQYILCLLRIFPNNTCRGINNGRGNVICAYVCTSNIMQDRQILLSFFFSSVYYSYQYRRDKAYYPGEWYNVCHRWLH